MPGFKFTAIDKEGTRHSGILLANDKDDAVSSIAKIGFSPISVGRVFSVKFIQNFRDKLPSRDKIFLARNLTIILQSGLGITEGIKILLRGMKNGALKNFLIHFILIVEKGAPISQAFLDFPRYFSPIDVEIVKIGEYSGNLASTLKKWAEDLERDQDIKNTVTSALIYPIIILTVATGVIIILITFVMPKIATLVQQVGGTNVPKATEIIINVSLYLGSHVGWFLTIFFSSIVALIIFLLSSIGKRFLLKVFIKSFFTRNLAMALALRNFCFLSESLLAAGVNLTDALKLMEETIFHPEFKKSIKSIREQIVQGTDFGDAIMSQKALPGYFSGIL